MGKKTKEQEMTNLEKEAVTAEDTMKVDEAKAQDEKDILITELQIQVAVLTEEIEKIKKAAADIVNRSKQMEVEKKYAAEGLVRKLLTPLSYFEGALKFQTDDAAFMNFLKGFEMIYNLILDTLKSEGLAEIVTNVNDVFDPYCHEVCELVECDAEKDHITEVVQKGYKYKDRVIKPVQVKVSAGTKTDAAANINDEENVTSETDVKTDYVI